MDTKTLDEIKDKYYGTIGTPKRDELESEMAALRIGVRLKEVRESLNLTQQELAMKIDKKRSFISKVENDSENITLKTLYDIVVRGLGGKLNIDVQL